MNKEVRMINHLKNSLILTTLLITLISCGNSEMLFFDSNENSIVSSISVNSVEDDIIIEWATEGNPDTVISIEKSIDGITYIVIGETTAGSENYTDIDGALVASETDIVYKLNIQNVSGDSLVDLQPETIEAKTISTINYGVSSGSTYYERIDLTDKDGTRDITGEIGATEIKSSVKDTFLIDGRGWLGNDSYESISNSNSQVYLFNFTKFNEFVKDYVGEGRKIYSATINFYFYSGGTSTFSIYDIQSSWNAGTSDVDGIDPTDFSDNDFFSALTSTSKIVGSGNYVSDHSYVGNKVDVTEVVQGWINGETNNGLLLQVDPAGSIGVKTTDYGKPPTIEIIYYDDDGVIL